MNLTPIKHLYLRYLKREKPEEFGGGWFVYDVYGPVKQEIIDEGNKLKNIYKIRGK